MKIFKPFKTKEEALAFIEANPLDDFKLDGSYNTSEFSDYTMAVCTMGIDPNEFPFIAIRDCTK